MTKFSNHLVHETSPYLLQHAHNPVNWRPWSESALKLASDENKPVLVSIGYSACHWCHVMERESFEDESVAELMNRDFINIKIDREERPDLDHIYMDAVQAMTGSGGWPLNVFLTPEGKPFYGGTYFPPRPFHNRPSWKDVLHGIAQAWQERKDEISDQADQMLQHLKNSNSIGLNNRMLEGLNGETPFSREQLKSMRDELMKSADKTWGGFGNAPKFPQTFLIRFLLNYDYYYKDDEALKHAKLSLDKMIQGGIYDHIGGGFARYSTDSEWLVPHFEKVTYDNALLAYVLADAYRIFREENYLLTLRDTLNFMVRDMMQEDGGFYSALDADSEGVEGKFYTWSGKEFAEVAGTDAEIIAELFDITEEGNWEHTNIPWLKETVRDFAAKKGISFELLAQKKNAVTEKLLTYRNSRISPALDDKCLLGWNALMNSALSNAFAATGDSRWLKYAERNALFMLNHFRDKATGEWYHTFKNGKASYPAFLDDLACLIQALILLSEVSGNRSWLEHAKEITGFVMNEFADDESPLFFYTGKNQSDVIIRKKEWYDGATPSGNAVMADNLRRLGIMTDNRKWRERSEQMVISLHEMTIRYPNSFGLWACLLLEQLAGTMEIVILGRNAEKDSKIVLKTFLPNKVFQFSTFPEMGNPMHAGKTASDETFFYLCRDYSCKKPVKNPAELLQMIEKEKLT